jgi:SAM-dependent methyltransferase
MDARHLGYENEFDLIGAYDVLEHIKEDDQVLSQIHTALTPGGVLCMTVPQHPWLYSHADTYACHERRYARGELEAKMESAGFSIDYSTSFVTLLLPLMVLSRLLQGRQPASSYDPSAEFRLSPMMNKILSAVMRFEFLFLRAGIRFPVGGSRLVVAHKATTDGG